MPGNADARELGHGALRVNVSRGGFRYTCPPAGWSVRTFATTINESGHEGVRRGPKRAAAWSLLAAAAVLLAWPAPYLEAIRSPNELVRVYLVRALVDERTVRIDTPVQLYGGLADLALRDGHLYSDKAPGLSFLGAPVYAFLRLFRPASAISNRELVRWLRFVLLVIPTVAWLVVLRRWLADLDLPADLVDAGPFAYAIATPAFAYCLLFMGHQAAAWMLGTALALAWWSRLGSSAARAAAGFLAGFAAITEYPTAPMLAAVALLAFFRARRVAAGTAAFAAGAIVPLATAAAYHTAAFGGPMRTGYEFLANPAFRDMYRTGFMGISVPDLRVLFELTGGTARGLLSLSPWLVFAVFAFFRVPDPARRLLVVVLAFNVALQYWIAGGYQFWLGGWSVGPRHVVPALPALAVLALFGATEMRRRAEWSDHVVRGLLAVSACVMCAIAVTFPGFPEELHDPVFELTLPMLADRQFSASLPHLAGMRSDLAMAPAILLAAIAIVRVAAGGSRKRTTAMTVMSRLLAALCIASVVFVARAVARRPPSCDARARVAWFRRTIWEPNDAPRGLDRGARVAPEGCASAP